MAEGLAELTQQVSLHQLALCAQDQSGMQEDAHSTHLDKDLPSLMHIWHHCPCTLIKYVLNVVHLPNLGQDLLQSQELLTGCTNLRFTITWSQGSDDSQGHHPCGLHGHRSSSPTSCDPGLHCLEVPCEVANIHGQFPWRISFLPLQHLFLGHKSQHQILGPQVRHTHVIMLPNGMPAHGSDEIAQHMAGSSLEVGLNGQ